MTASKIATCCYCGTRAVLSLRGKERHELACSNCGAPLHEMKMLRSDARGDRELVPPSAVRDSKRKSKKHRAPKTKRKKKNRDFKDYVMYQVLDAAEDIFDDVFDIFD